MWCAQSMLSDQGHAAVSKGTQHDLKASSTHVTLILYTFKLLYSFCYFPPYTARNTHCNCIVVQGLTPDEVCVELLYFTAAIWFTY